jgi:hypothetical protein
MISCSLSKFFFNLPKIEGGFYTCQTAGPLTQRGAVETADGLVFLGIPVNARAMSVGRGPARFRRASRSAEGGLGSRFSARNAGSGAAAGCATARPPHAARSGSPACQLMALSINHPSVAAELATPAIFAPTWARPRHLRFRHPDRVHAPLDRVYKLGVSLPDAPAARCESAWNKDPVFGVSTGTRAATAGCGISQSARPSGLAHRSSHASTAVAAICASPPSRRLCFGCHHKREAQMGEAEMVCLGAKDILPGGGRAVADR